MGWAPDPAKVQAAEEAEREAQEAIARRLDAQAEAKLSPFERRLLGLIEDLADAVKAPGAGPVLATIDPATPHEVADRIFSLLPEGSLMTGPEGPILDVKPLAGAPTSSLDAILDAPAATLQIAITNAARALVVVFRGQDLNTVAPSLIAEVVIEAALHAAAQQTPVGQDAHDGGAAAGDSPDPAAGLPAQ